MKPARERMVETIDELKVRMQAFNTAKYQAQVLEHPLVARSRPAIEQAHADFVAWRQSPQRAAAEWADASRGAVK